jgi:hypothetical protein
MENRDHFKDEPGEPLIVSGTVYAPDGKRRSRALRFMSITPMQRAIIEKATIALPIRG